MCRRHQLAGTAERISKPFSLKLELLEAGAKLVRHRVEGRRELGELVAAADGHAAIEPAAADRLRRGGELADGAHDRPALSGGDRRQNEERPEQHVEKPFPDACCLCGDFLCRCQHCQLHLRLPGQ